MSAQQFPLKLAIVSTHPIQYYAPVFRALAGMPDLEVRVFYTWSQAEAGELFDHGFGATVSWDVPLRAGYAHQFVANTASRPGTDRFGGIVAPTLVAELEQWCPDALLVYGWNHRAHLAVLRRFKGRVPVFFRGDSTLLDPRPWWRDRLRRTFLRWVYKHIDVAIAVGANNRDYFAWCGVAPDRIAIAPHSIDTVRFAADTEHHEAHAEAWRKEAGIAADAVVFLYAGKLQEKKDPGLLLEAFRELPGAAHLVYVGQGESEAGLREAARGLNRIHFVPFQNQSVMPSVYRYGDVFVLPSRGPGETWGLALNEAMTCARPVIASSRVGGARDLVEQGRNGWTFAAGDRGALVRTLTGALDRGRAQLHAMGAEAYGAHARWSTEASAQRIAAIVARGRAGARAALG
jgi:glycosyltransferase involved in cell wall biosynthesis